MSETMLLIPFAVAIPAIRIWPLGMMTLGALLRESLVVKTGVTEFVAITVFTIFAGLFRVVMLGVLLRDPRMIRTWETELVRSRSVLGILSGFRSPVSGLVPTEKVWHDMFADFDRDLLLLCLSDNRQRCAAVFARGADQNRELVDIHDLLIIIELQHIEALEASRGRRAVWHHSFDDKAEVFRQAELRCQDRRHGDCDDAKEWRGLWQGGMGGRCSWPVSVAGAIGAVRRLGAAILPIFSRVLEAFAMLSSRAAFGMLRGARTLRAIAGVSLIPRAVAIGLRRRAWSIVFTPAMSAAKRLLIRGRRGRGVWRGRRGRLRRWRSGDRIWGRRLCVLLSDRKSAAKDGGRPSVRV